MGACVRGRRAGRLGEEDLFAWSQSLKAGCKLWCTRENPEYVRDKTALHEATDSELRAPTWREESKTEAVTWGARRARYPPYTGPINPPQSFTSNAFHAPGHALPSFCMVQTDSPPCQPLVRPFCDAP